MMFHIISQHTHFLVQVAAEIEAVKLAQSQLAVVVV